MGKHKYSELRVLEGFLKFKISRKLAKEIRQNHPELFLNPRHMEIIDIETADKEH